MNILVTIPKGWERETFFPVLNIERLEQLGKTKWNPYSRQYTSGELAEAIKDTEILITGWNCPKIEGCILQAAKNLKLIAHTGGTVASIVSPEVYKRGIRVISGNELFSFSVAEGVLTYILAALRRLPYYAEEMRNGRWHNLDNPKDVTCGLREKTVGIVSFGAVAHRLVQLLQPFGVKILVYSRRISQEVLERYHMEYAELEMVFRRSDIISIHTAANPQTVHMIHAGLLAQMKDGALFVNTARGEVVDEDALQKEVQSGRIQAVLDVYEREPLPKDSLWYRTENVLLLPHIAGPTIDFRAQIAKGLLDDIQTFGQDGVLQYEIKEDKAFQMSKK